MALRFRRSIKVAKGVRINFSKSGVSASVGPRGASVTVGKRGTYLNAGLPGTGLSSRQKLSGKRGTSATQRAAATTTSQEITVSVSDSGEIQFLDAKGNPLSDELISIAKKQKGDAIRGLIQRKCDEINVQLQELGQMHIFTPSPDSAGKYSVCEFDEEPPSPPKENKVGFLAKLFPPARAKIEKKNAIAVASYESDLSDWENRKKQFDTEEASRKQKLEHGVREDVSIMEDMLEENLQSISWPRETLISNEINDIGALVLLDVDLPEIEDMPNKTASAPSRGYKLNVKEVSQAQLRKAYMQHVHSIGFRIIGEAFATLPNAATVVLSAFSQRTDTATGHVTDQYLYSVRVSREEWSKLNFNNLKEIDVVEALAGFDMKRNMSKTGLFKAIQPFEPK